MSKKLIDDAIFKAQLTKQQKLLHVFEWLYTRDGAYDDRNEWRNDLMQHLYWLAEVDQVSCCPDDCECKEENGNDC